MSAPVRQVSVSNGDGKEPRRTGAGRRWVVAVLVTVVVHGVAFFVLGIPTPHNQQTAVSTPAVQWVGPEPATAGTLLGERLTLFDNAPLFLPTQWNAANADFVIAGGRAPGEIFDLLEPRLAFSGERGPDLLGLLPLGLETPIDGLKGIDWRPATVFGRTDRPVAGLSRRLARIEVRSNSVGDVLIARDVMPRSDASSESWPDWVPFEVAVVVDPAAGAQPPLVIPRGSGSGVVDGYFREFIWRDLRLDLLLPAGYYRVVIGP